MAKYRAQIEGGIDTEAFYRAMTEGAPEDGTPLLGQPGAAGEALDELTRLAHRLLGKAAESEAFERRP